MTSKKKTIIIGLDGATFDLLDPWIDQNALPVLRHIRDQGVWATLETCFPPISPAAWATFMTGKNPGKHGVYDFLYRKAGTYEMAPYNGNTLDGKAIWDILSEKGRRVIVVNVPLTYPPKRVNGFLITGYDTPRLRPLYLTNYTYPKKLHEEIQRRVGNYVIHPRGVYRRGRIHHIIKEIKHSLERRYEVVSYLMEKYDWDFVMVMFIEGDKLQHDLWHLLDEKHPMHNEDEAREFSHIFLEFFQDVDTKIGNIIEKVEGDKTVVIISDHGHGPIYKWLYLNNWLIQNGFMSLKKDFVSLIKQVMFQMGWTPSNVYQVLTRLGFSKARIGHGARYSILNRLFLSMQNVDWSRTVAYGAGHVGQIYINLQGREPQGIVKPGRDYRERRETIRKALEEWRDPETGELVVEKVMYKEEIYHGPHLDRAADILFMPRRLEYWSLGVSSFVSNRVIGPAIGNSGNHKMNGILMAAGKDIQKGRRLAKVKIEDIVPTVLYDLGLPVPDDMDGRVLLEIFQEDFLAEHPVRYEKQGSISSEDGSAYTEEEEQEVIDRLRDLGYLG